jgi:four helix bundle protein
LEALKRLDVWRRACRFAVDLFKITASCPDRGFRDQITRSGLSIASNIAEGYERETARERIRFLLIAKGSAGECWTQLLIGIEAGLLPEAEGKLLAREADEIARMLRGLVKFLQGPEPAPPRP